MVTYLLWVQGNGSSNLPILIHKCMNKIKKYRRLLIRGTKLENKLCSALKQKKYTTFCKANFILITKRKITNIYIYEIGIASVLARWITLYNQI